MSKDELGVNMNFKKYSKYILPVLAVIGILLAVELTSIYYFANFVPNAAPSFCVINSTIDCDAVSRTAYAHFLGIPTSVYGLFFYLAVFVLSLCANGVKIPLLNKLKNPESYIFSLSTIAVFSSIALAWISSMQIHKICLICYVTYFINILILFASKANVGIVDHYKKTLRDIVDFCINPMGFLTILVLTIFVSAGLYYVNDSQIFLAQQNQDPDPMAAISKQLQIPEGKMNPTGNVLGVTNPKVIINEYTDFKCPFCAVSSAMLERLVTEVDGVQVVHHDFPLDNTCNKALSRQIHFGSCDLALYTRAAKNQGKYWDMISSIFDNQQSFEELTTSSAIQERVVEIAKKKNIDTDKLLEDAKNPALKEALVNNIDDALKLNITSTPTYFIGIKKHEGIMSYPELKKIVIQAGGTEKK